VATDLQKEWEERIKAACKCQEEWKAKFKVDAGIAYFEGQYNPGYPQEEWININKIYSHLQAQLPKLYSVDPYFYVKVKKSRSLAVEEIIEFERRGKVRQSMLNYMKGELGLKEKARMAIQDAHFMFGIIKVRRASDYKDNPEAGQPIRDDAGTELMSDDGQPLIYPDYIPVNERYEICRVHPNDFVTGEYAGPLEYTWPFLASREQLTKEEALNDRRFKKSLVKKTKGKARKQDKAGLTSAFSSRFVEKDADEHNIIDVWEIYDLKKKEWLIMAEGSEDLWMKPEPLPKGVEKHPFAILRFTLRDSSFYPIPPVFNAIDPQREMSLSRSRMMTHRKRFNRKYGVVVNKLEDPDIEIQKLEAGEDGTVLRYLANGAVEAISDAPLDQTSVQELAMLNNDIVEALGTPDMARGISSADSATEADILDARLGIREGDRMSMVVDFILTVARKLDQLIQAHITGDEAVKITGPDGEVWTSIREADYEEINGEFDYEVNVGASQPRLPDIERAQLIAFVSQVLIPFPALMTNKMLMKKFAELFHIADDSMIESLVELGKAVTSGQLPAPGAQGGGPSNNPIASILGAAGGPGGGRAGQ